MKRVAILGGGFGGLAAAQYLSAFRDQVAVTLIDRKATSDFLPLLPDVVGGRMSGAAVCVGLDKVARQAGALFCQDAIRHVDPESRTLAGQTRAYSYDALIIAAGSEPNFYGNRPAQEAALPLNTFRDAERLVKAVQDRETAACIIIGGGYTGVEVAVNLWRRFRTRGLTKPIVLVEAAAGLLGSLPGWMKDYTLANLGRLDIAHKEACTLTGIDRRRVTLSNGQVFDPALLIWCAGVQAPEIVRSLPFPKAGQGFVRVDDTLRCHHNIFAVGDAAACMVGGRPARMSVQRAITQGTCAAANVIRLFRGHSLRPWRSADPGFVLPMANGRSCGLVFGLRLRGRLPTALHYLMCLYRSHSLAQRTAICKSILNSAEA